MQLACGMQPEEAQYTAAAGRKPRSRHLSLQGATKARKVARARKEAEQARQGAEAQTVEEETKSSMGDEVEESDKSLATKQTEHAPEPEPFCPTSVECMSADNENCAYDPHLLDTVQTKRGSQAALNVLQESDRAWCVNRLFNEGMPLREEEDAWMRRLSDLCIELRRQIPQLRKMGLDSHLMKAMLESDGM